MVATELEALHLNVGERRAALAKAAEPQLIACSDFRAPSVPSIARPVFAAVSKHVALLIRRNRPGELPDSIFGSVEASM